MHILLTNDDGIDSPGIRALCRAFSPLHRVTLVAPDSERSAAAQSLTISAPIRVLPREIEGATHAYAVGGTPADCAKLGLLNLCDGPVDLVVSGINNGLNLGRDTHYSGTVGAAREATYCGVRALAVSTKHAPENGFEIAALYALRVAQWMANCELPRDALLNLNVPDLPERLMGALRVARLSSTNYQMEYARHVAPRGDAYYWLSFARESEQAEPDSDLGYFRRGHPTLTPLTFDTTCRDDFALLRAAFER